MRRGQIIVEYVLLMVVLMSLSMIVFTMFEKSDPLNRFLSTPKALFQGLSRSGAWVSYEESQPEDPDGDIRHHPSHESHYLQVKGREAR